MNGRGFSKMALFVLGALVSGCGLIVWDPVLPPVDLMWSKSGGDRHFARMELIVCGRELEGSGLLNRNASDLLTDINDVCMLKKGFGFVRQPDQFKDICYRGGVFRDRVSCRWARGNYESPGIGSRKLASQYYVPGHAVWLKDGAGRAGFDVESSSCVKEILADHELMLAEFQGRSDQYDECLLRKGFKFAPDVGRYRYKDLCKPDSNLWNNVSCRWGRGDYKLPEE